MDTFPNLVLILVILAAIIGFAYLVKKGNRAVDEESHDMSGAEHHPCCKTAETTEMMHTSHIH